MHTPLAASGGGGAKDAKRRLQIDPDYTVLEPDEGMGDPGACVRVGVWVCGCVGVGVWGCSRPAHTLPDLLLLVPPLARPMHPH